MQETGNEEAEQMEHDEGKGLDVLPADAKPSGGAQQAQASQEQLKRGKKRKVALFLAYVGAGYSGMQFNPNANTIEGVLREAIHRAGGITDDNASDFGKIAWTRAARTDKGVSAVGQVVSLKLLVDDEDTIVQRINGQLPPQIRVLGYVRVTNGFDARHLCDRRRYEYLLPVSAFDPAAFQDAAASEEGVGEAGACEEPSAAAATPEEAIRAAPSTEAPTTAAGTSGEAVTEAACPLDAGMGAAGASRPTGDGRSGQGHSVDGTSREAVLPALQEVAVQEGKEEVSAMGENHKGADGKMVLPSLQETASQKQDSAMGDDHKGTDSKTVLPSLQEETGPIGDEEDSAIRDIRKGMGAAPAGGGTQDGPEESAQAADPGSARVTGDGRMRPAEDMGGPSTSGAGVDPPAPAFAFDEECMQRLNSFLAQFQGTHNYHNFTARIAARDPTASRYILSFTCAGTIDLQGETWVRLVVVGQSFLFNQIRKMVGTVVAVMRGAAPRDAIALALSRDRDVITPLAPELGLFLDECYYVTYNRKWGEERDQRVALDGFQSQVDAFKRDMVYPQIAQRNAVEGVFPAWLRSLTDTNYKFSTWKDATLRPAPSQPSKRGGARDGNRWGNGKAHRFQGNGRNGKRERSPAVRDADERAAKVHLSSKMDAQP